MAEKKFYKRLLEKTIEQLLRISGTVTSITILFITLFLFKEGTSRAILRYGLVPARLPERKVQLKSESFVIEK